MSITVLSGSPLVATPVYNKMLYKVSGSLIAQPNYRYVCDVKNPAGTTLARLKCDKLLGGYGITLDAYRQSIADLEARGVITKDDWVSQLQ